MITKKILTVSGIILILGLIFGVILLLDPKPKLDSEINFFFWGNETDPPIIAQNFEKEFGVKVNVYDFSSESNMVDILKSGNEDYDVIGVTDIHINELIASGLISPMDAKNIPNAKNLVEKCSDRKYNLEKFYMAPVIWVTNGLVINTKYIPKDTDSWGILWNPEYTGKIALQDNRNDVIQVALKYIGYPVSAQNRFQLIEAKKFLLSQKPILRGYENQYSIVDGLISEELWAAHLSNALASMSMAANPDLKYIIPKEGSAFLPLGLAIPTTSKKKYTAEVFINYLLSPSVNADMAYYDFAAPCSSGAVEFLNKQFLENPVIYPSKKDIDNLESPADYNVSDDIVDEMENIWAELNDGVSR